MKTPFCYHKNGLPLAGVLRIFGRESMYKATEKVYNICSFERKGISIKRNRTKSREIGRKLREKQWDYSARNIVTFAEKRSGFWAIANWRTAISVLTARQSFHHGLQAED